MILNSPYISGSLTVTGNTTIQGQLTVTGSLFGTASLASNALLLQGTGSTGFATTASINEVSASQQSISASLLQVSASYIALSGSYNTFSGSASTRITENSSSIQQVSASLLQVSASYISLSGSYTTFSGSASTRITVDSASLLQVSSSQQQISASLLNVIAVYATTGSNSFRANQSITGSLVVSSTITAQTLVVQTVTSSIVYSSGSNIFGSQLSDRQTFTGSVNITGSITQTGVNTTSSFSGNVGIGITTPSAVLHTSGVTKLGGGNLHVSSDQTFVTSNSYTFRDAMGINNPNSVSYPVSSNYTVAIGSSGGGGSLLTAGPIYSSGSITVSVINYPQLVLNSSNNNGPQLRFQGCGSNTSVIGHISSVSDLQFSSTSSLAVQMNLSQAGNLSIGSILQFDSNGDFYQKTTGAAAIWSATANVTYPSYGFYGNTGIGMYRASADVLAFTTSACERMRITSCGKVGIIATDPKWLLEICCNTTATGGGGYPAISINNPNNAGYSAYYFHKGSTNFGGMELSNATCHLFVNTLCTFAIQTSGTERLRISLAGTSTFTTTENQGGVYVTSATDNTTIRIASTETGGQEWRLQSTGGTSGLGQGKLIFKVGGTETASYIPLTLTTDNSTNGGRVGIGTTTACSTLDVRGTITNGATAGSNSTIDVSPAKQSIANGACVDFPNMSGMIVVNDWTDGSATIFLVGGGSTTAVGSNGGTAGTTHYNGATAGYRWCNNKGYTANFGFLVFKTRITA